jgi:transposase
MPILYVLKGGISWRMLPRDSLHGRPCTITFALWRLTGLWDRIHDQLRDEVRVKRGRNACPSAAVLDSQSVFTKPGQAQESLVKEVEKEIN